ncbi:sigma-70 family RNA polymerase sigma factor [Alloacidobacterium dinghuense]|uniref:Sigma-70 family RNA polymerase sigma factor n=1 Tax=Alloacidobacterium dinghuense TaxID=2763107 RepID=A0A7G8BLM3_9BACT|nr:sigma-70 family RNA polymerase sigma factor [Alloacidobacterium dinghuense]QNI33443.1 sigma-70 family RNA polymerase sigma factor [Alloacidobacterium dinghuense]
MITDWKRYRRTRDRIEGSYADPDTPLVKLAKTGDVQAFELLVLQHKQKVYRAIFAVTKNREDTEDQVQETFLRAYRGLSEFKENSKFISWLTRIALNQALMCLRRRRYHHVSLDHSMMTDTDPTRYDMPEWRPNPEQNYADSEVAENLREALSRLPTSFRSVMVLRHLQEYTTRETANELGISVAAVKSRILRARRQLRDRISDRSNLP